MTIRCKNCDNPVKGVSKIKDVVGMSCSICNQPLEDNVEYYEETQEIFNAGITMICQKNFDEIW